MGKGPGSNRKRGKQPKVSPRPKAKDGSAAKPGKGAPKKKAAPNKRFRAKAPQKGDAGADEAEAPNHNKRAKRSRAKGT